jgi:hypothetical protein
VSETVSYSVDDTDRITWVNARWDRFALENDAPHLRADAVIGTGLWSHVSDLTLRHLLQKIFAKARSSRQPAVLTCRCDGPTIRRDLEVYLESTDGATVVVSSRVTFESPYPVPYRLRLPQGLLRICSWCNAVEVEGRWIELETAVNERGLLKGPHHPQITHTLCRSCEDKLRTAGEM